ncbi:hypothetical protein [Paraburkholderia elongata]|uniref:Uncharacterized protein n=1 Tax=Paraburkholderia elongata TaxID=2675747 RepID=A0A972SJN1_9BURK|nr:hypothetical protein [Paraburkholderia elongata]NPT58183.1 hypothetical protein [Paraburkholderia elongata]NPT62129.1 hypothetical protein [Paraburkholderia elongata]
MSAHSATKSVAARFLAFGALLLCVTPGHAAAPTSEAPISCSTSSFDAIPKSSFLQAAQTVALPVTAVLPSNSDAQFVLHQSLTDGVSPRIFRVFEIDDPQRRNSVGGELPVISVEPPPPILKPGYGLNNSVLLRVQLSEPDLFLWDKRYFVLLVCSGDRMTGWALTSSLVSDAHISFLICTPVALLVYLLAMSAVLVSRKHVNPLVVKYPAIFGAKQMDLIDFLNPIHLVANAFNEASVQKTQVLLFSFLVGWLVLALVLRTGTLVDLSPTIVGLLGISGIGAATAQITYQQKTRLSFENWAWLQKREVLTPPAVPRGPQWRDLVLTNREFDVYKLQTIIFSIAVAASMISGGALNLATFSVPTALLGILGLSQVVYVGGILVRPPAVSDLDDSLTKLRLAGETVAAAKAQKTDTGPDGKLLAELPPGQEIAANAQRQYDDLADTVVTMIESTLEVAADRSKLNLV